MIQTKEIMLRLLSSVSIDYDYTNFSVGFLKSLGIGSSTITKYLKELEADGAIKDFSRVGFCKRVSVLKPLPCPNFLLLKNLRLSSRDLLLKILSNHTKGNTYKKKSLAKSLNVRRDQIDDLFENLAKSGLTLEDVLDNTEYVTGVQAVGGDGSYFEGGGYLKYRKAEEVDVCETGETNEDHHTLQYILFKRFRDRFKTSLRIKEYNLTSEIILRKLKEQDYKCAYSGVPLFKKGNTTNASIDRIDSSKGYTDENTVIVERSVNVAKNTMSYKEFVAMCTRVVAVAASGRSY